VYGHRGDLSNELADLLILKEAFSLPMPPLPVLTPGQISLAGEILSHPKLLIKPSLSHHTHSNIQHFCWKILKKHRPSKLLQAWTLGLAGFSGFDFPTTAWNSKRLNEKQCQLCGEEHNTSVYGFLICCGSNSAVESRNAFLDLYTPEIRTLLVRWLDLKNSQWDPSLIMARLLLHTDFVSFCLDKGQSYKQIAWAYSQAISQFFPWWKTNICNLPNTPLQKTEYQAKPRTSSWAEFLHPSPSGVDLQPPVHDAQNNQ